MERCEEVEGGRESESTEKSRPFVFQLLCSSREDLEGTIEVFQLSTFNFQGGGGGRRMMIDDDRWGGDCKGTTIHVRYGNNALASRVLV